VHAQVKNGLNNINKDRGQAISPFDACKTIVCGSEKISAGER
jgi:hypothetical protein